MIFTRRRSGLFAPDPEPLVLPTYRVGLSGYVRATLRRARSGTVKARWAFPNMLVNTYLDALGTNTGGFPGVGLEVDSTNWFAAGTGTTAPAATNTALVSEIASGGRGSTTIINATYVPGTPDSSILVRQAVFTTTQANGTIGELGWFSASSAGSMRARCNPKDSFGNPTTIVKTSSDTLTIDWELHVQPLQGDTVITRSIGGVTYTVTFRAMGCNSTNVSPYFFASRGPNWTTGTAGGSGSALGARTQSALVARTTGSTSGTAMVATAASAYVSGSCTRDMTYSTPAAAAIAFLTNCGGSQADNFCSMQAGFSPALSTGQNITLRISWVPL